VDNIRKTLAIKVLQVELERVYMLLRQEVELSDDFNEQEILIAAFEGADIQLARLSVFADSDVALLVSDDELGLVAANVEDVRSRLGLETDAYISGWEWSKLQVSPIPVTSTGKDANIVRLTLWMCGENPSKASNFILEGPNFWEAIFCMQSGSFRM
jgi:hypothetical protein